MLIYALYYFTSYLVLIQIVNSFSVNHRPQLLAENDAECPDDARDSSYALDNSWFTTEKSYEWYYSYP